MTQRAMDLSVNGGVGFVEGTASFGMTELNKRRSRFQQHVCGYFTCPWTAVGFMHILRAGQTANMSLGKRLVHLPTGA